MELDTRDKEQLEHKDCIGYMMITVTKQKTFIGTVLPERDLALNTLILQTMAKGMVDMTTLKTTTLPEEEEDTTS